MKTIQPTVTATYHAAEVSRLNQRITELEESLARARQREARAFRSGWHEALDNIINYGADPAELAPLFQEPPCPPSEEAAKEG